MYESHDIALIDDFEGDEQVESLDAAWIDSQVSEEMYAWTDYPMLRGALSNRLAELDDDALSETLWSEGFVAEDLEGFMQVLSDIGRAVGRALPAIGAGAATGASVGSVIPGAGTGIGAGVGGILAALGSILGQRGTVGTPAEPHPAKKAVRPGVTRSAPTARPSTGMSPASSMQAFLRLLTNSKLIQGLVAGALGDKGAETIRVAGRAIPTHAFAELMAELSSESIDRDALSDPGSQTYLEDQYGEAFVDLASSAERAGGLIGLLAAEALDIELPDQHLVLTSPWGSNTEAEIGWPDDLDRQHYATVESGPDEPSDIEAEPEAAPAIIAVAGVLISGANLGLGVFDRLQRHALSGAFEVTSHAASYIHDPSPAGLTIQTRTFTFAIHAHHPRYGIGTQTFWFRVTLEYDGFNIRRASIIEDRGRSSALVSSDFTINFVPARYSAANEPVAAIVYNVSGRWDPIGLGDESFDGRLVLDAQGAMRDLDVASPQRWVRHGTITSHGGGPVPKPTVARHEHVVGFDRPGRTTLSSSEIRRIHGFYTGLPDVVRAEIAAGRITIRVVGRASTTASIARNQAVAAQRAESVASTLRELAGTSARFDTASHGELGARTADETEDPKERRADIRIEYRLYQ